MRDQSSLAIPDARVVFEGKEHAVDSQGEVQLCEIQTASVTVTVRAANFQDATRTLPLSQREAVIELALKPRVETPIVVTGTTEPLALANVNRSMAVLSVEDPAVPAWSFADILKQDPSIDLRERGPDGTQADLSIRGSGFDQVLVLVNGFRINDGQTGHHNLDLPLPFESVSQVEVLHGSGSTLYGSDAIGGAINFVTKKPEAGELKLMGGLGDFGWNRQSVLTGFKLGRWSQKTALARDFSTGYREGSDFRHLAFSSDSFIDESFGSTTVMFAKNDRPFGANGYYGPWNSWEQTGTTFVAVGQTVGRSTDALLHRVNFSFRRHDDHFVLCREGCVFSGIQYRPQDFQNLHTLDTYQATYTVNHRVNDIVSWSAGADFLSEDIDSTVAGQRQRGRGAVFAILNLRPTSRLDLSVGVRETMWKKWRGQTSPTFSAGYWLGAGFKLRGQVGNAFRIPSYTDLYYRDPGNVGNPALVPENAWNYEAGADWYSSSGTQVSMTWFERRESNTIDWIKDAGSPVFQARNVQDLNFHGGELQFRQKLRSNREVGVSYTAIRASRIVPVDAISRYVFNFPLNQVSGVYHGPLAGRLLLKMRLGALNRSWHSTRALWDGSLIFDGGRWQPFFQATNLLNTYNEAFQGLPLPGRWIRGGVQVQVY